MSTAEKTEGLPDILTEWLGAKKTYRYSEDLLLYH